MTSRTIDLFLGIPTYNSAAYLQDLFSSLLAQAVHPRRIVFSDDGSSDNTVAALIAFEKAHPELNVQVIVQEKNLGIARHYNALAALNNECRWTQILDADDYCQSADYFEVVGQTLAQCNAKVVVTSLRTRHRWWNALLVCLECLLPRRLPKFLPILGSLATRSGLIYRRDVLQRAPFLYPQYDGSDVVHTYPLMADNCYVPSARLFYRIHSQSATSGHVHADAAKKTEAAYQGFLQSLPVVARILYRMDFRLRRFVRQRLR